MKVVGLMGTIGAGKGTVAAYLEKNYGFETVTMGDIVREEADTLGLNYKDESGRKTLQDLADSMVKKNGPDYWMKKAIEKIGEEGWERIAIDGIRYPLETETYKKKWGKDVKFILIDAEPRIRFQRMKEIRNRPGDPQTLEEFKKQEEKEWEVFNFKETMKRADIVIDNNGAPEELYKQVDKALTDFLKE